MFDIELTIKNYRCVGDEPARIRFADGFTALIGINNSGKSSLLRLPYELRNLFRFLGMKVSNESVRRALIGDAVVAPNQWGAFDLASGERIFRADSDKAIELEIAIHDSLSGRFLVGRDPGKVSLTISRRSEILIALKDGQGRPISPVRGGIFESIPINFEPLAEAARLLVGAMYIGPFRNAINVGGQGQYYDIQVGEEFIRTFAGYKSGPFPEHNEAVAELMEEIKRIFGFHRLDINPAGDYRALQLTVDGRSYRLAEQGAGLAHFIIVLVNVLVRRPSLLLIDEPELNLHASLQLDFLQTLASYTDYGVIFATHSLGLARTAADRIYTITKPVGGATSVHPYDEGKELVTLLGQLSFDRRPDLGFNTVLLVEGKTELRALMVLLRLYRKEHRVLMLPLHGDEMIRGDVENELAEVLRVGGDVHYLIDSEREAAGESLTQNRQGFVDLCTKLGINGHVLERRALENYFTQKAVERAFGSKSKALGSYERKGSDQNWPKTGNWRIAGYMSRAELDGTDLGTFLENL